MSRKYNGRIPIDITPGAPGDEQPAIGLIGMGEMGRMYAHYLSLAGWKKYVASFRFNVSRLTTFTRTESMYVIALKDTSS